MPITTADLARYRAANDRFLPEQNCTVTHNGVATSTICRVDADRQPIRAEGLPRIVTVRRWMITMRDAIHCAPGDTIAVAGKGTYDVLDVVGSPEEPTSYSYNTVAYGVLDPASMPGHVPGTLPFEPNAHVVFTSGKTSQETPLVGVVIYEDSATVRVTNDAVVVDYAVAFARDLLYPDGHTHIANGDVIRWDERRTGWTVTLDKPRLIPGPPAFMRAHFHETD